MVGKLWMAMPVLLCASLAGCVSGRGLAPNQPVAVYSVPAGARAITNYNDSCITPCKLRLPNDVGGTISVEKQGYETATISIGSHVDASAVARSAAEFTDPADGALEIATGAVLGEGIVKRLDKRTIQVTLTPSSEAVAKSAIPTDPNAPGVVQRLSPEEIAKVQSPLLD